MSILIVLANGNPVNPVFYQRLIDLTIRDEEGKTSDTLTINIHDYPDAAGNYISAPAKGDKLRPYLSGVDRGEFEVSSVEFEWDAERGDFITIQAKGTDIDESSKLKEIGSETYPKNKTFKDIVEEAAKKSGLTIKIDPALAAIKYTEGVVRHLQSPLDFIQSMAEKANGLVKIRGKVLTITERGSGKNADGETLPVVVLNKVDTKSGKFSPGDRVEYGTIKSSFIDQKTGKKKTVKEETEIEGPEFEIKEGFKTEAEAKKAAKAKAQEISRNSGTVSFTCPGRTDGGAGGTLIAAAKFRPEVQGEWRIKAVEDKYTAGPSGGHITTYECTSPEGGKKPKDA